MTDKKRLRQPCTLEYRGSKILEKRNILLQTSASIYNNCNTKTL